MTSLDIIPKLIIDLLDMTLVGLSLVLVKIFLDFLRCVEVDDKIDMTNIGVIDNCAKYVFILINLHIIGKIVESCHEW